MRNNILFCSACLFLSCLLIGCDKQTNQPAQPLDAQGAQEMKEITALIQDPLPFKPKEFEAAIADYNTGTSQHQQEAFQLPQQFAGLTVDNVMYVTKGTPWGDLFLFVTWQGKDSNLEGYLYRQTKTDDDAILSTGTIDIFGPGAGPVGNRKVEVNISKTKKVKWYEVYRNLD